MRPTMSKPKWTEGPWTVPIPRTGEDVTIVARTPIHKNPVYVARIYGPGILSKGTETRDANARLIAQAPRLAEFAQKVADAHPTTPEAVEARAILAKIDGGGDE